MSLNKTRYTISKAGILPHKAGILREYDTRLFFVIFVPSVNYTIMEKTIHQGRNIKRFREMLGIKQEGLALELGEDWNQRKISLLEQKEVIELELLEQVAKVLKVPVEAIKNFDEDKAVNIIANTFQDESAAYVHNYKCTFNPLDKWAEEITENRQLYERLLQAEKEKMELLQKLLDRHK